MSPPLAGSAMPAAAAAGGATTETTTIAAAATTATGPIDPATTAGLTTAPPSARAQAIPQPAAVPPPSPPPLSHELTTIHTRLSSAPRAASLAPSHAKLHAVTERTVSGLDRFVKRIEETVSVVSKPLGVGAPGLKRPRGMKWRSSPWFLTAVVCIGVMSDLLAYAIIVPILPYHLLELGYSNVASLTSWLLFAYSAGVFLGSFPTAFFFHRYPYRRGPLVAAVLLLELSFLLFMLAEPYWCMVVSRFIQGVTSCVVWTVGFALICENIAPDHLGFYMGFAFTGVTIGVTIAPPIGGALYQRMGWYAPFVFCIIICGADCIARLFVLDVRDIEMWRRRVAAHEAAELKLRAQELGIPPEELATREAEAKADADAKVMSEGQTLALDPALTTTSEATAVLSGHRIVATPGVDILARPAELSAWETLKALVSLPRGIVAFCLFFVFGFTIGALDATITIRVEDVWHKDAQFVGLIYLAAAAPAFFVGPLAGHLADKFGTEWVIAAALALCLPWLPLMTLTSSLPGFVVYLAMVQLVTAMLNTVASLEMAIVSKHKEGISEIHQFAALNIAFAVSSAIGAICGGQIYDGAKNGWDILCWVGFALFVLIVPPPLIFTGTRPMLWRILGRPGPNSTMPTPVQAQDEEAAGAAGDAIPPASEASKAAEEAAGGEKVVVGTGEACAEAAPKVLY